MSVNQHITEVKGFEAHLPTPHSFRVLFTLMEYAKRFQSSLR